MADYIHGAYGEIQTAGTLVAAKSRSAIVYVGTAPVHTVAGGGANVNKPVLVDDIAQARKYFGYSEEWDKYTLCEAMQVHFENKGVGPLVLINVLDPGTHRAAEGGSVQLTPENGRVTIVNAGDIILDSVAVTGKVKGTDFTVEYDFKKGVVVIKEVAAGGLGTEALTVTYNSVDAAAVDSEDVIGESDGEGLNTGIYALKNVYQETGYIPSFLLSPGFAADPQVHRAMIQAAKKIGGHWDAYVFADIPIVDGEGNAITLSGAAAWKEANGYNNANETVYFPMAAGVDGRKYHLSVLAAANFQELLAAQDGIPYKTASNTECALIGNLYMGETYAGRVFDDELINEKLNKNGIASAVCIGGRWAIWGCHSADYTYEDGDQVNVFETNRMMLYYLSNDFQHRRARDVDKPMTANGIKTIVAEEQTRLDALVKIGALIYGTAHMNADADAMSDIMQGDYAFSFNVTTTPLAKSLTAVVSWTDKGYATYYADIA